ncbi:MAG: CBS domain-containing protein [Acidimicrobiales bacterium]
MPSSYAGTLDTAAPVGNRRILVRTPVIMLVNDDQALLAALERDLGPRYSAQYRLVSSPSGDEAVRTFGDVCDAGQSVALVVAGHDPAGMANAGFLVEARRRRPDAGHVLLAPYADAESAIAGVNQGGLDYYLPTPWDPAAERLYPVLDELLADWVERNRLPYLQVGGVMDTDIVRIAPGATLHEAAELVATSRVGDLMVVADDGSFLGVLSEGDVLRNALPHVDDIVEAGGTLHDAYRLFVEKGREFHEKPILPLVITDPIVMHPDDHVAMAAAILIARQIRRLPIVAGGRLVGTISRANVCRAVAGGHTGLPGGVDPA